MIYDICIIGGGPTGIALLNEYLKLKKKVIVIEKNKPFNSLHNYMKNMTWHSPWRVCKLEDNEFENVNQNSHPLVEDLITVYSHFIVEKKLSDSIIIDKIKVISKNDVGYNCLEGINNTYLCKKFIISTGFFDFPLSIDFEIINSRNIYRYVKNNDKIQNKTVVCIGGGFSSCDLSVKLQNNNKVFIFTHSKSKVFKRFHDQIHIWGQTNINHNQINVIEYANINKIVDNILYYDDKTLSFDTCFILIGYKTNYIDFVINDDVSSENIIRTNISTIEELYGGFDRLNSCIKKKIKDYIVDV